MNFTPSRVIEELGAAFYDPVQAASFPQHRLRFRNQRWAEKIGLGDLSVNDWIRHFGKFDPLPGSLSQPLALRYHGHQFRSYNPDIGDGRGFLFAQMVEPEGGRLLDLGTKGSGQTPYSRFGDGRLTLKGGIREVLATEMLEALGVNTSKSFSLIETGEALERNDEPSPTRAAVLVRLSHSHIRYGTFQRLAYFQQSADMQHLVAYCLRHLLSAPHAQTLEENVVTLLTHAVWRAANLAASYMAAGFVHGVLNTDNINITGESFDYGPYRFNPTYDLGFTAAYFDHGGLYSFGRQVEALHWNVYQLAKALLMIAPKEALLPALEAFPPQVEAALVSKVFARLGLQSHAESRHNLAVLQAMETALVQSQASLDHFYFDWFGGTCRAPKRYADPIWVPFGEALAAIEASPTAAARLRHAYFQDAAPCSLLIDDVELIWSAINDRDDWSAFEEKIAAIRHMGEALQLDGAETASVA